MFNGIGAFITAIVTNMQTIVLAVITLALAWAGYQFLTGNPQGGKDWLRNAFVGGALVLLAVPFLDRKVSKDEPSPGFTVIGLLALVYLLVFTIVGYYATQ